MKLSAVYGEIDDVVLDGDFTFESARALIESFDDEAFEGADMVLTDENGVEWFFSGDSDEWEKVA